MPLCNLLVHLTGDEKSDVRLRFAINLARSRDAKLTGLFARIAAPVQIGLVNEWPTAEYSAASAASREAFALATQGIEAEWQDLDRGAEAELIPQFVDFSRHFDLIVLGQPRNDDPLTPTPLAEETIIQSGRPVLVLPLAGEFEKVGARPIFGWSDSRSSARGFYDGMTLALEGAEAVVVGLSKPGDSETIAYQKESLRLAATHLAAHKIEARHEQLSLSDIGLMDALLNLAADHGADLLSIGAFGGWRYPLFARGSGSRYMLKHMTLPVLFSH